MGIASSNVKRPISVLETIHIFCENTQCIDLAKCSIAKYFLHSAIIRYVIKVEIKNICECCGRLLHITDNTFWKAFSLPTHTTSQKNVKRKPTNHGWTWLMMLSRNDISLLLRCQDCGTALIAQFPILFQCNVISFLLLVCTECLLLRLSKPFTKRYFLKNLICNFTNVKYNCLLNTIISFFKNKWHNSQCCINVKY